VLLGGVLYLARAPILTAAGRWLTFDQPLAPADVAIMSSEADKAGLLELADLYAAGTVPRVALVTPAPSPIDAELARRGALVDDAVGLLGRLGVPADRITRIDAAEGGTTDGTAAIARWGRAQGIRSAIIVTSATHGRRLHRALARAMVGAGYAATIRQPRLDAFQPDEWWRHRSLLRAGLVEWQKLALDYVVHPLG